MSKVNLDALLQREYMYVPKDGNNKYGEKRNEDFKITDLEQGAFFLASLKKPDFQRETSDWTPEKICDFIQSFINGDLIPSIIMWYSGNYTFVIDGAHRLSALLSWVHDDYGDGYISRPFFTSDVDPGIVSLAKKTKMLVDKTVGSYSSYKNSIQNPLSDPKFREIAIGFGTRSLKLQWVPGDAETAEKSFFKINESATPINETEKRLLRARRKPNAIAARAIIHAGGGHKFWQGFSLDNQEKIEALAKIIYGMLFTPDFDTPHKTLDLPVAGKGYSTQSLELISHLINLSNNLSIEDKSHKRTDKPEELSDDLTGEATIKFLKQTKKVLSRITGTESASLGLHPAIYFYSDTGRHQFTSLMAWVEIVKDMELHRSFEKFLSVRRTFEDFLISNKILVHQIIGKYGSGVKSYKKLFRLFKMIISKFQDGSQPKDIINVIKNDSQFYFIKPNDLEIEPVRRADFSTETKSSIFFKQAFPNPMTCGLCDGYLHVNSIQVDHIQRIKDGGLGQSGNGHMTHPICNSIKA